MAKSIRYILRAFQAPFGGPLQIRRHVKALAESGFDARMVTDSLSDNHFYDLPVPTLLRSNFNPTQSDICVIPEGWRKEFEELGQSGATLICLCQNHFYVHLGFKWKETFATFGINTVICGSRQVANHVERYYGVPDVQVIPCGIEMPPEVPRHKELAISFMPRKAPWSHSSVLVSGAPGGVRPSAYRGDEPENAGRWFSWRRRTGVRHFKERILVE
jgi:hypothetical protein